jgi:hypothetical protein
MKLKGTDQDFYSTGPDLSSEAEGMFLVGGGDTSVNYIPATPDYADEVQRLRKALDIYRSKFKCQDAEDILSGKAQ